ncbi:MAG: 1-acyl-sn-glycerol-3-phosphate acyltransferase [Gammaproteobacteria bacterium]|nr:MAG: 1-acyl-sn-glycerol-3-phosphate acyltransferase [Gammaproteobacteria bacterium]
MDKTVIIILVIMLVLIVNFIILAIYIGRRYNNTDWGHPFMNILDGLLRFYCQRYHRQWNYKIDIPKDKKILLASNHISALDPFLLVAATDRPIRFMIAKEEYDKPILNRLFKAGGCIPVDRGGRVEGAFRSAMRAIEKGEIVAIFPQGGIHCKETPREIIKPGIMRLSKLTGCDILPVRISGVAAPGSMVSCLILRGDVEFDVHPLLSTKEVQMPSFRNEMSQWLLGESETIECHDKDSG